MKFIEDQRIKVCRKSLAISWIFFSIYLIVVMGLSYVLGTKPYVWGLPRWIAIGNILVPAIFVILLIFIVENFIPNISLTDDEEDLTEEKE